MGPNLLWIVLDTARADAFEPYGAPVGTTPTIAQLARSGHAFSNAYSTASWTMPSHVSMFTGLLPRSLGLGQAPGGTPFGCRPVIERHEDRLFATVMRQSGYRTVGVSTNLWINEQSGLALGFDEFLAVSPNRTAQLDNKGRMTRLASVLEAIRSRADDGARAAEQFLNAWLDRRPPGPFFAFVNLMECHSPYLPPRPYNDLLPWTRVKAAAEARRYLTLGAIWRAAAGGFDIPADTLERMRYLYQRCIQSLDDWIARMLQNLDRRGLLDDTVVLVTADHGENLGECDLIGHAFSLDNRLIHVPLVVSGPASLDGDGVVSLAQLPRLLADALGVEKHPWERNGTPAGIAVSEFDALAGPDDPRVHEAIEHWGLGEEAIRRTTSSLTSATDGHWKLLSDGRFERLYDLDRDPLETQPVDPHHVTAPVDALRQAIGAANATAEPVAEVDAKPAATSEEVADIEQRMRQLGYL